MRRLFFQFIQDSFNELLFVMTVQVTGDRTDRIGIAAELIYLKAHLCKIGLIALQQMGFPG